MKHKYSKIRTTRMAARLLLPHPCAQRDIVPSRLKYLKEHMDLDKIGVLSVVEYEINGIHAVWIIDGQHRWQALMDLDLGDWEVQVAIYTDVTDDARAAELFLGLDDHSQIAPLFKFKAKVHAGYEAAVGVVNLLKARGLEISRCQADGKLCCAKALETLYKEGNGEVLATVLDIIMEAWGRKAAAFEGKLLEGLGLIIKAHGGSINHEALIKKLKKHGGGPSGIVGDARTLMRLRKATTVPRCVAEVLINIYNAGRSAGRLDEIPFAPRARERSVSKPQPGYLPGMKRPGA